MNVLGISVCISLRASSPIWASEASLARTRERGAERPLPLAASPLARSRETRFTRPNRRACSEAMYVSELVTETESLCGRALSSDHLSESNC